MRYRKRIVALIALAAVFLFVLASARREGSGQAGVSDSSSGGKNSVPSGMESTDPAGYIACSEVCVASGDLWGCGSIWDITGEAVTVITASHVIADEGDISVILPDGEVLRAEALENDPLRDYCFLKAVTGGDEAGSQGWTGASKGTEFKAKDHGLTSIRPADSLPQAGQTVFMVLPFSSESDTIGTVGLLHGASEDSVYVGTVISPKVYSQDFGEDVILCSIGVFEGMSGGGLFDEKGQYLGLLLGGNDDSVGVFLSAGAIVR